MPFIDRTVEGDNRKALGGEKGTVLTREINSFAASAVTLYVDALTTMLLHQILLFLKNCHPPYSHVAIHIMNLRFFSPPWSCSFR